MNLSPLTACPRLPLTKYWLAAIFLFLFDWAWGMAQVRGIVPLWSFLVLNFPFAFPYIWLESHWQRTHYSVAGHTVSEWWSPATFVLMVLAQAALYRFLWCVLGATRKKISANPPHD
jgi:hypothetical protein